MSKSESRVATLEEELSGTKTRRELTRNRLSLGISGGVIDHQNLVSRRLKSLDALKRTPQACGPIPGADDNRDSQNLYPCKTKVRIGPIQSARY